MIGTVEALGVFLLAVLPGYVGLRCYAFGRAPFRTRGALGDLGAAATMSLAGWALLYLWWGREVLATALSGDTSIASRIDAFAELVGLATLMGLALGATGRLAAACLRGYVLRDTSESLLSELRTGGVRSIRQRFAARFFHEVIGATRPSAAWDRLFAGLTDRREPALCRVRTRGGEEVLGVMSWDACADWDVDGRGLLLVPEVAVDESGRLNPLLESRGVFIPGDEVATLRVVVYQADKLLSVPRDG